MHIGSKEKAARGVQRVREIDRVDPVAIGDVVRLVEAGDRLSACKSSMRPIALTLKKTAKKYSSARPGELMLVHLCDECGKPSINRIAADDDIAALLEVLGRSGGLGTSSRSTLAQCGIVMLEPGDFAVVREQLYGRN